MSQLICIRHANIDAKTDPELSCKTCCTIFVNALRERRRQNEDQGDEWVREQQRVASSHKLRPNLT
jgi:hypothetical protein